MRGIWNRAFTNFKFQLWMWNSCHKANSGDLYSFCNLHQANCFWMQFYARPYSPRSSPNQTPRAISWYSKTTTSNGRMGRFKNKTKLELKTVHAGNFQQIVKIFEFMRYYIAYVPATTQDHLFLNHMLLLLVVTIQRVNYSSIETLKLCRIDFNSDSMFLLCTIHSYPYNVHQSNVCHYRSCHIATISYRMWEDQL